VTSHIPVSRPFIGISEVWRAASAVGTGKISGLYGEEIEEFERRFANFNGSEFAVACSSGTAALHLSLVALGIGPGDEVLVSDITNMASFFAVLYTGATPIPVDVSELSMTMDPIDLKQKISPRARAIMPVHLFGQPCDMDAIVAIARENQLEIVEDCAEAHGASVGGKRVGSFGVAGCFSFFANKIITTGEGGMITTNNAEFAADLKSLRSLNFGLGSARFLHRGIGFNYRMTNLQATIGIAQLHRVKWLIESRIEVELTYKELLKGFPTLDWQRPATPVSTPVTWMAHLAIPSQELRHQLMEDLKNAGIETRPGFIPFSLQDKSWAISETTKENPVSRQFAHRTMYLPTWSGMRRSTTKKVASKVAETLEHSLASS